LQREVLRDPSPSGQDDGNYNYNCNSKYNGEMRGSLHCATHDEAVSGFGRDDAGFLGVGGFKDFALCKSNDKDNDNSRSSAFGEG